MALKIADRIMERTNAAGTGSITLQGAFPGYRTFSAAFADGDQVPYAIVQSDNFEVGTGTLTAGASWTLSRDIVATSSNADAKIDVTESMLIFVDATMSYFDQLGIGVYGDADLTDITYETLFANGDVGMIADTLAPGDHTHDGLGGGAGTDTTAIHDDDFASEGLMYAEATDGSYSVKSLGTAAGTVAHGDHTHDPSAPEAHQHMFADINDTEDRLSSKSSSYFSSTNMTLDADGWSALFEDGVAGVFTLTAVAVNWNVYYNSIAVHAYIERTGEPVRFRVYNVPDSDMTFGGKDANGYINWLAWGGSTYIARIELDTNSLTDPMVAGDKLVVNYIKHYENAGVVYFDGNDLVRKSIGANSGEIAAGDHTHDGIAIEGHKHLESEITNLGGLDALSTAYWECLDGSLTWNSSMGAWVGAEEDAVGGKHTLTAKGSWATDYMPDGACVLTTKSSGAGNQTYQILDTSGDNILGSQRTANGVNDLIYGFLQTAGQDITKLEVWAGNPGDTIYIKTISFYESGLLGRDTSYGRVELFKFGTGVGEVAEGDHNHVSDDISSFYEAQTIEEFPASLTWNNVTQSSNRLMVTNTNVPHSVVDGAGDWAGYRPQAITIFGSYVHETEDTTFEVRDTSDNIIASGIIGLDKTEVPIDFATYGLDIKTIEVTVYPSYVSGPANYYTVALIKKEDGFFPIIDEDFSSEGVMYRDEYSGNYSVKAIGTGPGEIAAGDHTHAGGAAEDENKMSIIRSGKDVEGIFTVITWKRADTTVYKTSTLTGTTPMYNTRTEVFYEADGTTVASTTVFALVYNDDYDLESETIQ